ncbi:hypothetical protein [Clostridium tarantellae]|uniref:Uncharacterized protein n=1 Tax=Clostridium tarantellae TaxID=39493 RepID=A0A6I1MLY5_9CLOT|nr:hypothetical protein [Clostridium tarantellae]MPQ43753.1 hypothetical protein [Clostridium tarantellae]
MAKIKSKPVPFTDNEVDLLEWAEGQDKPFATYVKDLIRADFKKHQQYKKEEIKDIIKEVLQELGNDITINKVVEKTSNKISEKSKKAYRNNLV